MVSTTDESVDTPPAAPGPSRQPRAVATVIAAARRSWRQLTSMRTALVLLFLLALGAIPGSVLPQRSVKVEDVNSFFKAHPELAPVLDRMFAFDVYASPWFAAIYLLLFTSLIGCVVPRLRDHVRALRMVPPEAPKRLSRLPQYQMISDFEPARLATALTGWRTVRREHPDGTVTIAAEKGYLKETGNLIFHGALLAVLIGVGVGSLWGWHANRVLVLGPDHGFCNTVQQLDEYSLGPQVSAGELPPFCLELTDFQAGYLENGQPTSFKASVQVTDRPGAPDGSAAFTVNQPLRLDVANVYLLGHGYAPVLKYTDATGRAQTGVNPFLPKDNLLTSEGVAIFPDANGGDKKKQMAFEGLYLPTAEKAPFTSSRHPAERAPALMLWAYRGDLGLDAGIPGSVYSLDQRQIAAKRLNQVGEPKMLRPGEVWTLDDGSKIEFVGTRQWVSLSIRHDPGDLIVLGGIAFMLVGLPLSLYGKRRRVWLRVLPDGAAEVGGLPRTDYPGFAEEFSAAVERLQR